MKILYFKVQFAILIAFACLSFKSYAVLIPVTLIDLDGPSITGVVDTSANNFTINSWIENPGGIEYYTPVSLPLVWNAQTAAGAVL